MRIWTTPQYLGAHVADGHELWELHQEPEEVLCTIQPAGCEPARGCLQVGDERVALPTRRAAGANPEPRFLLPSAPHHEA